MMQCSRPNKKSLDAQDKLLPLNDSFESPDRKII